VATTVHIPSELLRAVDEQAKRLKLTRNRFIIQALKHALAEQASGWSDDFVRALHSEVADPDAVDEMLQVIKANRSTKKPPGL
jgi:metal-responsive CopG/Arc/MetJ family transcriptional regulator